MSENDLLIYINHIQNIEDWKYCFCDLQQMVVTDYVITPFECAIGLRDHKPNLDEQLFELHTDLEAKSILTRSGFCTLWSSGLVIKRYTVLSKTVLGILLALQNSYMVEAGFSHINAIMTKKQNRLDVDECGDQRQKITNLQPNIMKPIECHQLHPSH